MGFTQIYACAEDTVVSPPRATFASHADQARLIATESAVAKSGCAFVLENGLGGARVVALSRNELPFPAPSLDSVRQGRASKPILHVVRFTVYPQQMGGHPLTIACYAPSDRDYERRLEGAIRSPAVVWTKLVDRINRSPEELLSTSAGRIAGERLRLATFPTARRSPLPPIFTFSQWDADTGTAHSLPPVEVTASRNTWTIDQWAMLQDAKHWRSFSEVLFWEFYYVDGPDCATESDYWILEDEEIRDMEQYLPFYQDLTAPLQGIACERIPGKRICIDLWIMNHRSFVFNGNDRDLNPYAGINESKAQIYFDPDTKAWEVKIATTYILITDESGRQVKVMPRYDSTGLFRPDQDIQITTQSNGDIDISFRFMNNYCVSRMGCPAIDGTVTLRPDPTKPGGFNVGWSRDGFPSMAVFNANDDGTWATMAFDPEKSKNPYFNWLYLIGNRKSTHRLPPGCNLQ